MAQQLVWKAWRVAVGDLEQTLNDMQHSGFSLHDVFPSLIPGSGISLNEYVIIASRFEPEPEQERIGIPVTDDAYAFYQTLPSAEQQAMLVLLGGMLTRYCQEKGMFP